MNPPSHRLGTPYVNISALTVQRDEGKKGPQSSGLIRRLLKSRVKLPLASGRKGLILKVLLSAS